MENVYQAGAYEITPRYLKKMFQEPVDYERKGAMTDEIIDDDMIYKHP